MRKPEEGECSVCGDQIALPDGMEHIDPPMHFKCQIAELQQDVVNLKAAIEFALNESGCDGDLCMHRWHEVLRAARNNVASTQ